MLKVAMLKVRYQEGERELNKGEFITGYGACEPIGLGPTKKTFLSNLHDRLEFWRRLSKMTVSSS